MKSVVPQEKVHVNICLLFLFTLFSARSSNTGNFNVLQRPVFTDVTAVHIVVQVCARVFVLQCM